MIILNVSFLFRSVNQSMTRLLNTIWFILEKQARFTCEFNKWPPNHSRYYSQSSYSKQVRYTSRSMITSLSLSISLSFYLSPSLSHTHTLSHTHSFFLFPFLSLTFWFSLSNSPKMILLVSVFSITTMSLSLTHSLIVFFALFLKVYLFFCSFFRCCCYCCKCLPTYNPEADTSEKERSVRFPK